MSRVRTCKKGVKSESKMQQVLEKAEKGKKFVVDKYGKHKSLAADLSLKNSLEGIGALAADAVTFATQHGLVGIAHVLLTGFGGMLPLKSFIVLHEGLFEVQMWLGITGAAGV